jgi:site-specific DNA-methyltransferase (adenine-specific)
VFHSGFGKEGSMIICGDNVTAIERLIAAKVQVDSVVTDPPYGLKTRKKKAAGFMGCKWDAAVPTTEFWEAVFRILKPGGHVLSFGGTRTYHRMVVNLEDAGFEIRDQLAWIYGSGFPKSKSTALKPAMEPIVLARKPLGGTVAENVRKHGTGCIRIDACRVSGSRWPANVLHDGSEAVLALFPHQTSGANPTRRHTDKTRTVYGAFAGRACNPIRGAESGSAARFFYCAKASKTERNGSKHPTIKPLALIRYLCRLITPPHGTVLDPFAGSGSTGEAAVLEQFNPILIEREAAYIPDIKARLARAGR